MKKNLKGIKFRWSFKCGSLKMGYLQIRYSELLIPKCGRSGNLVVICNLIFTIYCKVKAKCIECFVFNVTLFCVCMQYGCAI